MIKKDFTNRRILLKLELHGKTLYYSDVDGPAHKYSTSYDGELLVEDEVIGYRGLILSVGNISSSFNVYTGAQSISNASVKIFNEDDLHLGTGAKSLDAAVASLYIVRSDMYDEVLASVCGRVFGVKWDASTISFTIKNLESTLFKNVPEVLLQENTFQTQIILDNAYMVGRAYMRQRFAIPTTYATSLVDNQYASQLVHKDLLGHVDNYWKGARVDVYDAEGEAADPESEMFCIGEFGIVVRSADDSVYFNRTIDRYVTYTFIDESLRVDEDDDVPAITDTIPYEMREPIGNTLKNVLKSNNYKLINADWSASIGWNGVSGNWSYDTTNKRLVGSSASTSVYQPLIGAEGGKYRVTFRIETWTGGTLRFRVYDGLNYINMSDLMSGVGTYDFTFELPAINLSSATLKGAWHRIDFLGSSFSGTIGPIRLEALSTPKYMITRRSIPENSDSVGKAFPIVYGRVEKMLALHAISSKSTRQNSFSAGDDVYIIAGHKIQNQHASELLVYFGLDEDAKNQNVPPGVIDFVPNPLPRSVEEIDRWHVSGADLRSGDPDKDTCPLHKLIEVRTNDGNLATAIKLRGDEYDGFYIKADQSKESVDSGLPFVDGYPSFPIRYGLGNSKIYVTFNGIVDENASITGVVNGLIEHPIDIVKHFFLNYTNVNESFTLNEDSFAVAKSRRPNWKFGSAITDIIGGKEYIERILEQCFCGYRFVDGVVSIYSYDLKKWDAKCVLESTRDFIDSPSFSRSDISKLYNDFVVRYAYDYPSGSYSRVAVRNKRNDQICRDFYSSYSLDQSMKVVELLDVYDKFTANAYADILTHVNAKTRISMDVQLVVSERTYDLRVGDVVSITMPNFSDYYMVTALKVTADKIQASFIQLVE